MLTLYMKETCPFCQRVIQMADNLKVEFDLKDITESEEALAELIEKGGKKQIPFLVDSEKEVSMYESNDIIDYIRENYANTSKGTETKPRVHMSDSTCVSCEG